MAELPRRRADWAGLAGGGLIGAGAVLGLVYALLIRRLMPGADADRHAFLLASALSTGVLVASTVLVVAGSWPTAAPALPTSRQRRRVCGGLLGASLCAVLLLDSLNGLADPHGAYVLLSETWWLPAAAGVGLTLVRKGALASVGRPARPRRADALPLALLAVTVGGALVTRVPPLIAYTFTGPMGPHTVELGLFALPKAEIAVTAGQTIVIVALAAAAGLWRPARFGAVLLIGAVVALADTPIAAIANVIEPPSLDSLLSVTATPWLWAYCGFTAALIVVYGWLFIRSVASITSRASNMRPAGP